MAFHPLLDQIRKSVVFIGTDDPGDAGIIATGFLIMVDQVVHLVTAKHVVADRATGERHDGPLVIHINDRKDGVILQPLEAIRKTYGVDWVFHRRHMADIAMIPFAIDPEQEDVVPIPLDLFADIEDLHELDDVFSLSYQPDIDAKRVTPFIRSGTIGLINPNRTFYLDAAVFPGNSGSPVFLKPSPIRFAEHGVSIGTDPQGGRFLGLLGEYIPYQETAFSLQTARPRVIFEENTGISLVWSATLIREVAHSKAAREQIARVKGADGKRQATHAHKP
jgi:hypothetical protein